MAKIGNYIHAFPSDYEQYGISKKRSYSPFNFQGYQKRRIKELNKELRISGLTKKEKQRIADYLQSYFVANQNPRKYYQETEQEVNQWVENQIKQQFGSIGSDIREYWNTGKVQKTNINVSKIASKKLSYGKDYNYWSPEIISNKLKQLDMMVQSGNLDANFGQRVKELQDLYERSKQVVQNTTMNIGGQTYHFTPKHKNQNFIMASDSKLLIQRINQLITDYSLSVNVNDQQGQMFEYTIGAALQLLVNKGNQGIQQMLTDTKDNWHQGKSSSSANIDISTYFDSSYYKPQRTVKTKNGNIVLTQRETQDKIDIQVEWKTNNPNGESLLLPISAKNIQSNSNISVVSGQSLLFLLQDESANMINHYLNLVSINFPDNKFQQEKQEALTTIKLVTLYKAIAGSKLKNGGRQAKVLIANIHGKIYVETVQDLMNKLIERDFKSVYGLQDSVIGDFKEYNQYITTNSTNQHNANNAQQRITRLLQAVHATKLDISIPQSAVTT